MLYEDEEIFVKHSEVFKAVEFLQKNNYPIKGFEVRRVLGLFNMYSIKEEGSRLEFSVENDEITCLPVASQSAAKRIIDIYNVACKDMEGKLLDYFN